MQVREVLEHHFRLPRRGEEMAHFFIFLCFCIAKNFSSLTGEVFLLKYRYFK